MAARLMKYINDVNMATGETFEIMPDGTIYRDGNPNLSYCDYVGYDGRLPENWEGFLAIRKMVIPADGWMIYPIFAWVWIDADYNVGIMPINDTSWRVSNEAWNRAYDGTIRALIGDLRRTYKLEPLMAHVYCHNIGVYTTWSGKHELTIVRKGQKQWLSPLGWLGDKLLFIAAEDAKVPDGRFYVAKGANKKLGDLIDEIESGEAYDEYWTRRDADEMLAHVSAIRKADEVAASWNETPKTGINIKLPNEINALVYLFQRDTGACRTARVVAEEAILDGYQPTEAGILEWIRDNSEWFANHNISVWQKRAIEWLTKPTDIEAMSEPCEWPEYSKVYIYAYTPFDKYGNLHKVSVFLNGAKSSMIKISDVDGRNPKYFQGCEYLGYFSKASDYISAWERGDLRDI